MPIEVELPDGSIAEFPDGTDNATMERALAAYAKPRADFSSVVSRSYGVGEATKPGRSNRQRAVNRARLQGEGEEYRARLEADRMRMDRGLGGQALIGAGGMLSDIGTGLGQLVTSGVRKQLEVPARALNALGATDIASRYEAGVVAPIRRAEERQQKRVASERVAAEPLRGSPAAQAGGILAGGLATAGPGVAARGTAAGAALLPTTIRGNALAGAVYGAAAPVASDAERAGNMAAGATLGGALTALPAGVNALAARTRAAAIPDAERAAARTIEQQSTGPLDIQPSAVPGVRRTLGEATMDSGVAALERVTRRNNPAEFSDIDLANNAARVRLLEGIAGDDAAMASAIATRDARSAAARDVAFTEAGAADKRISDIEMVSLGSPVRGSGVSRALDSLAKETSGRGTVTPVLNSVAREAEKAPDTIAGLYRVRQYVTDLIQGKAGSDMSAAKAATRELMQARDIIDSDLARRTSPGGTGPDSWENYLQKYQTESRPINRMEIGRELLSKSRQAIENAAGDPQLMPAAFAKQANDLDALAQRATGFGKAKASQILNKDDITNIRAVYDDLRRQSFRQSNPAQPGSATQESATLLSRLSERLGLASLGRGAPVIGEVVKDYQAGKDQRMQQKIAYLIANPAEFKRITAKLNEADKKVVREIVMQFAGAASRAEQPSE